MEKSNPSHAVFAGQVMLGVFGVVFGGIGLTVIGFLWVGDDGFGGPPLVFKLFGSFISLAFVAAGGAMVAGAVSGVRLLSNQLKRGSDGEAVGRPTGTGYACPHCGAALGSQAEVSPMGDVKCAFCGRWFNVHGRS